MAGEDQSIPTIYRILVVDDDASAREMVTRVLTGEGYSVWQAADGAAALDIGKAVKFDLALLDLNLQGGNGLKTFETLVHHHPSLAVIMMTARSKQNVKTPVKGVGAIIEKPLDFTRLLQTVSRLLAGDEAAAGKPK
jgi:DNA-binding response OmpR family regulator